MQFRRQRGEEVHVNLTPLIDVVFLLLIFFMVSTTFQKESYISLTLPEANGESMAAEAKQIEIVISAQGEYAVNNQSLANNQLDTLRRAIKEMAGGQNDLPVIISADAIAPHQSVITAMEAAGKLGFTRLSITTQQRAESQ